MGFEEYQLCREIMDMLDQCRLIDEEHLPVDHLSYDHQLQMLSKWWNDRTDPRGKVEKSRRLIQSVINIVGKEQIKGKGDQDLIPLLTDIRNKLMQLHNVMPSR